MPDDNDRKTAPVKGSSRGIGREVAHRLARDGFAVVVNYAGYAAMAEEIMVRLQRRVILAYHERGISYAVKSGSPKTLDLVMCPPLRSCIVRALRRQ